MLVNKRELARVIQCSLPTVDRLIERHGERFPIVARGTLGREWQFDAQAVVDFLREVDREQEAAGAARDAELQQFVLPLGAVEEETKGLKPTDLLALAKVREAQRREAREVGFLVETAEVRQALGSAFARLAVRLRSELRQAAQDHNLPDAVTRALLERVASVQRDFAANAEKFLQPQGDAPHEPFRLSA